MLSADDLKAACLALPGAVEDFPFGEETSVFKVAGKMFAAGGLGEAPPLRINLKCDPELAIGLRRSHPAILPGYHMNKRHWNTVVVDGSLADRMVLDLIEDSYDLVVASLTKAQRAALELPRDDEQVASGRARAARRAK
jgi:predicted DNA-binding protein (MmcQ/YjbR family)